MEHKTKWCSFCRLLRHACCHVCSARWNGRCVDRGTAAVYSYTAIKPHGVPQANWFPFQILFTLRKNYRIWNKKLLSPLQSYKLQGKQPIVSDFSRLLRHVIEKGRGPILYSKKKPETPRGRIIREIRIHESNFDVLCILAMRLHKPPKGTNLYWLLSNLPNKSNPPWASLKT